MPDDVADNTVLIIVLSAVGTGITGVAWAFWQVCRWFAPKLDRSYDAHMQLVATLQATSAATHSAVIATAEATARTAAAVEANSKKLSDLQKINEAGLQSIAEKLPEFCRAPQSPRPV